MPIERCHKISVEACAKQCVVGKSGVSCAESANAFLHGRGTAVDVGRGLEMARLGCDLGDSPSCTNLAWLYSEGKGVERNPGKAAELHERACNRGWMLACSNFGVALAKGEGVDKDVPRAMELFRRACASNNRLGQMQGCYNLSVYLLYDADHPDQHQDAVDFLHRSARAGHGWASLALVGLHREGRLLDADPGRIRLLLYEACSRGEAVGCKEIQGGASEVPGVPRGTHQCEYERVYECRDQCDRGHAGSCKYLASMLHRSDVMEHDSVEALRLYELSCKSGDVDACGELATFLEMMDAKQNADRIRQLRGDSCKQGSPVACAWLSFEERDPAAKTALIEKACRWGAADACRKLARDETDPTKSARLERKACRLEGKPDCES